MSRACGECRYYDSKSGECRRRSPDSHGVWPQVKPDKWCGDWLPRGGKVQAQQAVAERKLKE